MKKSNRLLTFLALSGAVFWQTSRAHAGPEAVDWSATTMKDLASSTAWIEANHPGMIDQGNPEFLPTLAGAFEKASTAAAAVQSFEGYVYTLRSFFSSFHDGHLSFRPVADLQKLLPLRWPGIVVARRDNKVIVHRVIDDPLFNELPAVGAELIGCDGKDVTSVFRSEILPYNYQMSPVDEIVWTPLAPSLLVDRGNPFAKRPNFCTFRYGGVTFDKSLNWRNMEPADMNRIAAAQNLYTPSLEYRPFGDNSYWISLPTFSPKSADETAKLRNIVSRVARDATNLRHAKTIVIDVRGNHGGNSAWGDQVATAIWGDKMVAAHRTPGRYEEWRVSSQNYAFLVHTLLPLVKMQFGEDSAEYKGFQTQANEFKVALDRGDKWLAVDKPSENQPLLPVPSNPVRAKVYFLTDGSCFSSCLLFADELLAFPGVTHIGLPTGADTRYGDVQTVPLPSGYGTLVGPQKIFRGRTRLDNMPYVPAYHWAGEISDNTGLERWIDMLTKSLLTDSQGGVKKE